MMLTGAESKHPENAYPGNVDAGNSPHGLSRTRQRAAPALVQILPLEIPVSSSSCFTRYGKMSRGSCCAGQAGSPAAASSEFPEAAWMLDTSSGCFDSALQ